MTPKAAPYGSWKSPITSDAIVSETLELGQIVVDGTDIYWLEMRPSEGGRCVVVKHTLNGVTDMTPPPFNVRTRVHEYGGGAFSVADGVIYFSQYTDQRLYRQDPGEEPRALTPDEDVRYADSTVDPSRRRIICVREDHSQGGEAVNTLVSINCDDGESYVMVSGNDFYSSPRLSPDGSHLVWLTWNHPCMPWDGTELWIGKLGKDGSLNHTEKIAGSRNESIFQPEWSPEGVLHFVSDRTGWWNLYRYGGEVEPLCEMEAEFGVPQWIFGRSTYGFESAERIICTYTQKGTWYLAQISGDELKIIETPYTDIQYLKVTPPYALFRGSSPREFTSIVQLDSVTHEIRLLRCSSDMIIDRGYLSVPRPIEFPTERGLTAHGFYYPPKNRDYDCIPSDERPPLIVMSHGGPTDAASNALRLSIQYWTSRGIGVLQVNYGGSTGYGRMYRQRLEGQWGIIDVEDCINGALYLVKQNEVDSKRLAIKGGSAGGYTTLCALTFHDVFKAGASYYGVSDLEALTKETHKFESHYLDSLVGPYPQRRDLYIKRSPIHFVESLSCPVIFFQGLEDKVVLPNQAEKMVEALTRKGLPVAYIPFEGEQHGFRRSQNIKRTLDAELYFYSQIFGFNLAEPVEPVHIENFF